MKSCRWQQICELVGQYLLTGLGFPVVFFIAGILAKFAWNVLSFGWHVFP